MKRFATIILTAFILFNLFSAASAQTGTQAQRLERDLNRLHEKIIQARQFAAMFSRPALNQIVQSAETQYNLAREAFNQHQYIKAASHIKLGFAILGRLFREIRNNPFFKLKFKEKLDSKLEEADQVVANFPNREAREMLNRARYFRQRAYQLTERNQPELALKHYFIAIFFADNAIRTARGITLNQVKNLDSYFENTNTLFLHARELAGGIADPQVETLLRRARQEYRKAKRLYSEQKPRQAYQQLQLVNRLLYRALDMLEKTPASVNERLQADIELLQRNLSDLGSQLNGDSRPELRRLYERLSFMLTEARQKYQAQDYPGARQRLAVARRLLLQLHRRLNRTGAGTDRQIEPQLQTAETMLKSLQSAGIEEPLYNRLLQLLEQNLQAAQTAYQQDHSAAALQYLNFFNRLALQMDRFRSAQSVREQSQELARRNLQRLRELLNQNEANWTADSRLNIKYQNALKMYEIARQACEEQQYGLCWRLTKLAMAILTK